MNHMSPAEAFPAARRYATKALELDPSLAESHASMAFVKLYFDWDWSGADVDFRRAIALDPNYAPTHQWYSIYLLAAGLLSEALYEIQLARQRDALSVPINADLGFHYYYAGCYEEAVKQLKFVLEMNKDFAPAHLWLGRTYQELGRIRGRTRRISTGRGKPSRVARFDCGTRICRGHCGPYRRGPTDTR